MSTQVRPIDANQIHYTRCLADKGLDMELAAKCVIDKIPTLDYAPVVHAEWKRTVVARHGEMHTLYVCSECNDYHGFREDPGQHTFCSNYLYCRTCGAKMDKEAE